MSGQSSERLNLAASPKLADRSGTNSRRRLPFDGTLVFEKARACERQLDDKTSSGLPGVARLPGRCRHVLHAIVDLSEVLEIPLPSFICDEVFSAC